MLLSEFCISGEHSEFIHINKVCNVPPQILGVLVDDKSDTTVPSFINQGRVIICSCVTLH